MPEPNPAESVKPPVRPRTIWMIRLVLALGVPFLFLLGLEGLLRALEFGYPTSFFIEDKASGALVENPKFGWRFFPRQAARVPDPVRFARQKAPNTYRIFVFGESAALGDPAAAYGLSRFLSVLLSERYPDKNFEVINTAMTAINSNVILPIAKDCAKLDGDCWVFYMGNNEVVGPFGAGTVFGAPAPPLSIIRANLAFRSFRLGQWLEAMLGKMTHRAPVEWGGMEMMLKAEVPADDPRLKRVYETFSRNLEDCIGVGVRSGARVVVSQMQSNLKDSPPFASQKGAAAELNAEGQYRAGMTFLESGKLDAAFSALVKARDLDTLRFRCDSELNRRIELAANAGGNGVRLVKTAGGTNQIPGAELFWDHVHFTFHGNYLLALGIAEEVERALDLKSSKNFPTEKECAALLAYTDWDHALIYGEMLERFRRAPFTNQFNAAARLQRMEQEVAPVRRKARESLPAAAATYRQALAARTNDYVLHDRFGAVLEATGNYAAAGSQWRRAVELMPQYVDATFKVGAMAARLNEDAEAEAWFRKTLALRPSSVETHSELAMVLASQGKTNEAVVEFKEALRLRPTFAEAHVNWGLMLAKAGASAEAEEHYRAAIGVNPRSMAARMNLGKLLLSQKKIEAAIEQYREAVKIRPDDAKAHFSLASALQDAGRVKEAQTEYEQAVRCDPAFALARLNLGVLLANAGDRVEARAHFEAAAASDPNLAEAEFYLGMTYLQENRLAEGSAHLEKVLKIDPQHAMAKQYLERLRARLP